MSLLLPHISSFRHLNTWFCTTKALSSQLEHGSVSRQAWIDLAASMTACPEKGFIPEEIHKSLSEIQDRAEFFDQVRALICPWTSRAVSLPMRFVFSHLPANRYMFLSPDNSRLIFQGTYETAEQISCPSSNGPQWRSKVRIERRQHIEERVKLDANGRSYEREMLGRLTRPFDIYAFTNSRPEDASFFPFPVHGGVFAILASFDKNMRLLPEGDRGIYFFAYQDCRMLTHKPMSIAGYSNQSFVQSRPGQLWILGDKRLQHFRRSVRSDPGSAMKNVILSEPSERMDEAFYRASIGDSAGALDFLRRDLGGLSIDTQSPFNSRTVLHYAAKNGHADTVAELMDADADPLIGDLNGDTPLRLACRSLHHECVFVMAEGLDIPTYEWEHCWFKLCKFDTLKRYLAMDRDSVQRYCNVSIPEIVRILLNNKEFPDRGVVRNYLMGGLRSHTILASADATRRILTFGGEEVITRFNQGGGFKFLFGGYGSPEFERESLKTLRMAVESFGLDVNARTGVNRETHLVWAIRQGSMETVKVLIEDLGAHVSALSNSGEGIRAMAVTRFVMCSLDTEAGKILEYLDLHVFRRV